MSTEQISMADFQQRIRESLSPLIVRYQGLSTHEHIAVMGLLWATIVVLVLALVVVPLYRWQLEESARFENTTNLLAWIKSYEGQFASASGNANSLPSGGSLQTVLIRDASQKNINLQRYEPKGNSALRVWINEVSFTDLIQWLADLEKRFGIKVGDVTIEHKPQTPGMIKATIVFNQ